MIRTVAYALVDQQGNPSSVYLEHERAMSAVACRRGAIVQDLVLRETAAALVDLLVEARNTLSSIVGGEIDPGDVVHLSRLVDLIDRTDAELRRTA